MFIQLSPFIDEFKFKAIDLLDLNYSLHSYFYELSLRFELQSIVLWQRTDQQLLYLESFGLSRKERKSIPEKLEAPMRSAWQTSKAESFIIEAQEFTLQIAHSHPEGSAQQIQAALQEIAQTLKKILAQRFQQSQNQDTSQRLQSVLAAAKDGIFILNQEGQIIEWNPSAAKLLGQDERDLHALKLAPLMFEKRILKKFNLLFERLQNGQLKELRQELKGLNKKTFEINISAIPFSLPLMFMVHFRDITERKRINTHLKETKARLQTMIDHFQGGILMENTRKQILLVNHSFCQMFELPESPQMLVGQDTDALLREMVQHFKDPQEFQQGIQKHYEEKKAQLNEVFALREQQFIELDYVPVKSDRSLIGHLWVFRDATEKMRNSEELEILSRFPGEDPNPVMRISQLGEVLYANIPAIYLLHYWHRNVGDFVPGFIQEYVEQVLNKSRSKTLELAFGKRHFQVLLVPFAENQYVNFYATDITARLQAEADALQARDIAVSASETKSIFLATMSHEIRTPLNAILGMIDVVLGTPLNSEQEHYLHISRQAGLNLLSLINTLLDFSRIEAGKMEFENIPFQIAPLMEQTIGVFSVRAQEKGLDLRLNLPEHYPEWLKGDGRRLSQIMFILIDNALKFTAQGSIALELLSAYQEAELWHLNFQVKDTGIGIPEDKQAAIFESFQQADSSTTRKYGGSGLGLSIASQLVQLFGGKIQLESHENQGSCFRFFVSLETPSPEEIAEHRTDNYAFQPQEFFHHEGEERHKLLIVEDSPENRLLMKAYFKHTPLNIHFAHNGREAVEQWQAFDPDLILMDIQMPEMDGFTATQQIREAGAEMPIIALTADALKRTRDKCLDSGFNEVLTKPIQQSKLFYAIEAILNPERAAEARAPKKPEQSSAEKSDDLDLGLDFETILSIQELIDFFWEQRRADSPTIQAALEQGRWEDIVRLGHSLKGSGSSYGFMPISDFGVQIEAAALKQDRAQLLKHLEAYEHYLDICEQELIQRNVLK